MFCWISLVYSFFIAYGAFSEGESKLLLVQTLFRHGDRAPRNLYPKDPNKKDLWPNGLGKLTLTDQFISTYQGIPEECQGFEGSEQWKGMTVLGKKQQYALGKFLRFRYQDFITTNPNEVLVNSSAVDRCLTSAAANVAAFYAPEGRWKLDYSLNWQPIPIHYLPLYQDKYLSFRGTCPRVDAEMKKERNSEEIKEVYQKYKTKLQIVSNYSGLNLSKGVNAFHLYDTLRVEKLYNLTIPDWVDTYWEDMKKVSDALFRSYINSPVVLRLRVGPLLEDINQNMRRKINGDIPDLKVQMYSAHDINLAAVLLALNLTNMPRPPYCATLLFELHEMSDATLAVRLLYLNSTDPLADMGEPRVLELTGCSEFCPVEEFTKNIEHLIPENWEQECQIGTGTTVKLSSLLYFLLFCSYIFNILSHNRFL